MADDPIADAPNAPNSGAGSGARAQEIEPDWFDFDELKKSSSRAQAELSAALGAALAEVEAARRDIEPEVAAARVEPPSPRGPEVVTPLPPPPRTTSQPREASARAAAPRTVLALLATAVVANVAVAAIAWRTLASVDSLAVDIGRELRAARPAAAHAGAIAGAAAPAPGSAVPDAPRSLEMAERMIAEREFSHARRALCELLAVADAFDEPARREIEARARFLYADAWRLEAESAAAGGDGG